MRKLTMVVLAGVLLAGLSCQGGDDPALTGTPETTETPQATAEGTPSPTPGGTPPVTLPGEVNNRGTRDLTQEGQQVSLEMELNDFYFDPTFVHTENGARVVARLHNRGSVPHTFTVQSLDEDHVLQPGEETEVTLTLPAEGPIPFVCRFHEAQGMKGAFFYQAGS